MLTQFAETRQICGKFAAYYANMVNYVPCKTKREKSANFGRRGCVKNERKEAKNGK